MGLKIIRSDNFCPKSRVLNYLKRHENLNRQQLADALGLHYNLVCRVVTDLIDQGYLKDIEPGSDGYRGRTPRILYFIGKEDNLNDDPSIDKDSSIEATSDTYSKPVLTIENMRLVLTNKRKSKQGGLNKKNPETKEQLLALLKQLEDKVTTDYAETLAIIYQIRKQIKAI